MTYNDWWMQGTEPALKGKSDQVTSEMIESAVIDPVNQLVDLVDGDALISQPGLAIGVASKAKVAFGELVWQKNGMRYRIAAGDVAFTATTHDIADPDTSPREAIYVLSVAAAATAPTITKGTTAAAAAATAPATPDGHVKIGEVKVQHNGSAIFDASSDDLDAAHLTITYTDAAPLVVPGV